MGEFFIWVLIFAIVYMVFKSMNTTEKPPEEKKEEKKPESDEKEYTKNFKQKIAVDMIKGKSAEDIIKDHPSLKSDEITKWKDELLDNISRLTDENAELSMKVGQLYMRVQWLEKTCQKNIGDDWKEKTGYKYL